MLANFLLIVACIFAVFLANSSVAGVYFAILEKPLLIISKNNAHVTVTPSFLVNEVLMVCFFLFVSLEIKRGFIHSQFRSWKQSALPLYAALGGIIVPALLYYLCNFNIETQIGWAIPTTTDIAFSLGILSLLSKPVAPTLKLFLSTLAIFDDLCAIIIIAFVYTERIAMQWLVFGGASLLILSWLNIKKIQSLWPYGLYAIVLWYLILQSGVHATIAGVLVGFFVPYQKPANHLSIPTAVRLEKLLKPWVDYLILPSFALVNAGFQLKSLSSDYLWHPVFLGIFLGLAIGKPLGILLTSTIALKTGIAQWPESSINWSGLTGVACLGGIGFTMSLLMAVLAFQEGLSLDLARQSILFASLFSAGMGYLILQFLYRTRD